MKKLIILFLILNSVGCATKQPLTELNIRNAILSKSLSRIEGHTSYTITFSENQTVTEMSYAYKSCTPIEYGYRWSLYGNVLELDYGNNLVNYEVTQLTSKKVILKNNKDGKSIAYKLL